MLVFEEGGKTGGPSEKIHRARTRTNNKLNPHMTPGPGIEPGPHSWEANAPTTAPSPPLMRPTKWQLSLLRNKHDRGRQGH